MQDDVTDATRWAIEQGIADPERICIYGGSYGAYAAMMGAAREPDLYACAAGYVGVYDLDLMVRQDKRDSRFMSNFTSQWIGEAGSLSAVSPTRLADRIKAPVFLAAGGEDRVAPVEHTELMESALRKAGVPVESLVYKNEGHGFYKEEHRAEYYRRLLGFLSRHIGGQQAK
jgi:dipeptidyl aminopeptidase/acylaminoacyl peptidase